MLGSTEHLSPATSKSTEDMKELSRDQSTATSVVDNSFKRSSSLAGINYLCFNCCIIHRVQTTSRQHIPLPRHTENPKSGRALHAPKSRSFTMLHNYFQTANLPMLLRIVPITVVVIIITVFIFLVLKRENCIDTVLQCICSIIRLDFSLNSNL